MFIDSHCHFFTKSILTNTTVSFLKTLTKRTPITSTKGTINNIEKENLINFINAGINNTPEQIYKTMVSEYKEEIIAVPKMLDLTFASSLNSLDENNQNAYNKNKNIIVKLLKHEQTPNNESTIYHIIKKLNNTNLLFKSPRTFFSNSLHEQIDELVKAKQLFKDRIYPFFSIDPRHTNIEEGILNLIKKNVGKDKPFVGVKLYTSLGYSPTDPLLYNKNRRVETVYQWCEKNHIPITVHFSDQGFSNLLNTHPIKGHVYYPEAGYPVLASDLYENSILKYHTTFPTVKYEQFVKERLISLNHPSLWRIVLENYPKLKINFAHFGGNKQIISYLDGSSLAFWTKSIIEFIHDYKNVYSDLSCFDTKDHDLLPIKRFHDKIYSNLKNDQKDRILYGSDYFMLLLFENDLGQYLNKFKKAFEKDFTHISVDNPARFLGLKNLK